MQKIIIIHENNNSQFVFNLNNTQYFSKIFNHTLEQIIFNNKSNLEKNLNFDINKIRENIFDEIFKYQTHPNLKIDENFYIKKNNEIAILFAKNITKFINTYFGNNNNFTAINKYIILVSFREYVKIFTNYLKMTNKNIDNHKNYISYISYIFNYTIANNIQKNIIDEFTQIFEDVIKYIVISDKFNYKLYDDMIIILDNISHIFDKYIEEILDL
jgi:hypothetical protein